MTDSESAASDGEEFDFRIGRQDWVISWHPAALPPPSGRPHGASAVCITPDGDVLLVSQDGKSWDLPGGRPEAGEDLRETLDREVLEEACVRVEEASLLGFTKGVCKSGPEKGLILVRSVWRAAVSIREWDREHEMSHRRFVPFHEAVERISFCRCPRPVYERAIHEAWAMSANNSLGESKE